MFPGRQVSAGMGPSLILFGLLNASNYTDNLLIISYFYMIPKTTNSIPKTENRKQKTVFQAGHA
jgi:hypothetical protein